MMRSSQPNHSSRPSNATLKPRLSICSSQATTPSPARTPQRLMDRMNIAANGEKDADYCTTKHRKPLSRDHNKENQRGLPQMKELFQKKLEEMNHSYGSSDDLLAVQGGDRQQKANARDRILQDFFQEESTVMEVESTECLPAFGHYSQQHTHRAVSPTNGNHFDWPNQASNNETIPELTHESTSKKSPHTPSNSPNIVDIISFGKFDDKMETEPEPELAERAERAPNPEWSPIKRLDGEHSPKRQFDFSFQTSIHKYDKDMNIMPSPQKQPEKQYVDYGQQMTPAKPKPHFFYPDSSARHLPSIKQMDSFESRLRELTSTPITTSLFRKSKPRPPAAKPW